MSKVKVQEVCVLLRPPSLICRWPPPAVCSCGPLCAYVSTFLLERTSRDFKKALQERTRDFPGGPVVKTPLFQCRGCRLDPCLRD